MLNTIGRWVLAKLEHQNPLTNVYGLARTLLALSGLVTLIANGTTNMFVPLAGTSVVPPVCESHARAGIFCVVPDLELARWIAIGILALVATGWRPRVTAVPHWWIAASLQWNATILDGGDQVAMVLTLLLLPMALLDGRRWHWGPPQRESPPGPRMITASTALVLRIQVAAIYYHAGVAKYAVEQWRDGTALWYWFHNPTFGAPESVLRFIEPILASETALPLLTWSVLVLEFLLASAIWMRPRPRVVLLVVGLVFHASIALIHGITSFSIAMFAALVLYLRLAEHVFRVPSALRNSWAGVRGRIAVGPRGAHVSALAAAIACSIGGCWSPVAHPTIDPLAVPVTTDLAADPGTELDDAARLVRALEFVDAVAEHRFAEAAGQFAASVRDTDTAGLRQAWMRFETNYGGYRGVLRTTSSASVGFTHVNMTLGFESANIQIRSIVSQRGEITSLTLEDWDPPTYGDRLRFREHEVTIGAPPWQLPGTFTLPEAGVSAPAVVLVHGSGPADRDETVGRSKVFRDLAWGLASRGIAVLRYEKRTREHATSFASLDAALRLTVEEETVDDAVAAVAMLRARPDVDPARIFVLGHSLGGYLAPRIAAETADLAGVILASVAVTPLPELVAKQLRYLAALDGNETPEERAKIEWADAQVAAIASLDAGDAADSRAILLGAGAAYWRDLAGYDPLRSLSRLDVPALVLGGARDYQVPAADRKRWRSELARRAGTRVLEWPELDHMLAPGTGPSSPKDYGLARHVDARVIEAIAGWIRDMESEGAAPVRPPRRSAIASPGTRIRN